jgi:hypothetical protein
MYFLRRNRYVLAILAVLVFCSVMVIRQIAWNENRHVEKREAFILLHSQGYTNESTRLFQSLLADVPRLSNRQLMNDFQRTVILVDPSIRNDANLIWKYHWTISKELEKRTDGPITRALKLANEQGK